MKIALIGCGFIGNALKCWIEHNNPAIQILVSDPFKGYHDDVYDASKKIDAYFIQIHVLTNADGTQDINDLVSIVKKIPAGIPVWIRTTILSSTFAQLREVNDNVEFLPEFLTQRTALDDFNTQPMVFTGNTELLKKIFHGKKHICMTSEEAILAKYVHNVFGALKVTYFNCINEICQKNGLDFSKVRECVLASGYINDTHTQVPGPDGKFGYGGKCFPKDVNAFVHETANDCSISKVIQNLPQLNDIFRK